MKQMRSLNFPNRRATRVKGGAVAGHSLAASLSFALSLCTTTTFSRTGTAPTFPALSHAHTLYLSLFLFTVLAILYALLRSSVANGLREKRNL